MKASLLRLFSRVAASYRNYRIRRMALRMVEESDARMNSYNEEQLARLEVEARKIIKEPTLLEASARKLAAKSK